MVLKDSLSVAFTLTTLGLLVWGPMTATRGGPNTMFSYHPLLMGLGFALMISIGFWMFNYEDLPGMRIDSRVARRNLHICCQVTGVVFVLAGYGAVVLAHRGADAKLFSVSDDQTVGFSSGPNLAKVAHIVVGYVVLALMAVQVALGVHKHRVLTDVVDENDGAYGSHERIGNMVYAGGLGNILLGVWLWEGWTLPIRGVITLMMITSMAFGFRWDGSRGYLS